MNSIQSKKLQPKPDGANPDEYSSNQSLTPLKSNAIYDLYAISQHYGSLSSGHYTALCRNRNRWYSFDDEKVSRLAEENIVTSAAYLLFYKKSQHIV